MHLFDALLLVKPYCSSFRITSVFLGGVQIFRIFTVLIKKCMTELSYETIKSLNLNSVRQESTFYVRIVPNPCFLKQSQILLERRLFGLDWQFKRKTLGE